MTANKPSNFSILSDTTTSLTTMSMLSPRSLGNTVSIATLVSGDKEGSTTPPSGDKESATPLPSGDNGISDPISKRVSVDEDTLSRAKTVVQLLTAVVSTPLKYSTAYDKPPHILKRIRLDNPHVIQNHALRRRLF